MKTTTKKNAAQLANEQLDAEMTEEQKAYWKAAEAEEKSRG